MIYSVKGTVTHIDVNLTVVECAGVGYACRTTANTLSKLKIGEQTILYTHFNLREDLAELFGFFDTAELSAFKMLISVSGVGPKAALSILSDLSPQGFALCVASGDSKSLTRSQGIGTKIAQRIVLELKDKIDKQNNFSAAEFASASSSNAVITGNRAQAVSALLVLGFSSAQAADALRELPEDMDTSLMIKNALKRLAENKR